MPDARMGSSHPEKRILKFRGNRAWFVTSLESGTDVSVIVCSKNRRASLQSALDAIRTASQNAPDISVEIIVVDNGSTDGTESAVKDWNDRAQCSLHYIYEPRPGLAAARNTGMRASRGRIIALTDDDCIIDPNYFSKLCERYSGLPVAALLGGRVELGDEADLAITIKEDEEEATFCGIGAGGFILGCNMSMTRQAYQLIGEMDEKFGAGATFRSAEDTDYVYRAYLTGVPVIYSPELGVRHYHGRRSRGQLQRLFYGYNYGNGALYAKYFRSEFSRQLRWDCKNAVRELFGGATFKHELGLTYRSMVLGNLHGMLRFWFDRSRQKLIPAKEAGK